MEKTNISAKEYDKMRMQQILEQYEPGSEKYRICKDLIAWRPEFLTNPELAKGA